MAKLTREQKIEIYHKKKSGVSNSSLSKQYDNQLKEVHFLLWLNLQENKKSKYITKRNQE